MKKFVFFTFLAIMGSFTATAQDGSDKMNNFKVNLFSPIVKSGSFFYERKINEKSSLQLGFGFTAYNKDQIGVNGIFITPEYRIYLSNSKEAIEGFYLAPFLRYQGLTVEDKSDPQNPDKAKLTTFGGGLTLGYQWIFKDIISLDVFLGPNYNSGKVKLISGNNDPDTPGGFNGFGARAGLALGIVF